MSWIAYALIFVHGSSSKNQPITRKSAAVCDKVEYAAAARHHFPIQESGHVECGHNFKHYTGLNGIELIKTCVETKQYHKLRYKLQSEKFKAVFTTRISNIMRNTSLDLSWTRSAIHHRQPLFHFTSVHNGR